MTLMTLMNFSVLEFGSTYKRLPKSFPDRSSYLELFSDNLEKYLRRTLFIRDVWLINEHQTPLTFIVLTELESVGISVARI